MIRGLPVSTIALCVIIVIANMGGSIISPVLPTIQSYFRSSAAEVALMVSGFGLGRLAMDLPAGILTDRVSPARMFAVGILVSGVAAALAAFSTDLQQLILFRTAMGVGSAIMSTVALVVMVNIARPDQRGQALAFYTSCNLLGSAISPMIGGYLATLFSWQAVFLFCALTPLISLPLNLLVTRHAGGGPLSAPGHGKVGSERRAAAGDGQDGVGASRIKWAALITVYASAFLCYFDRNGMQSALLPLYAGSVLGMDPASIGNILSLRAILTILILIPAGALADRIGRKQVLIPGMLVLVAGNLGLLAGQSVSIFIITVILVSLGVLGNNMLSTLVADLVPERRMGRGMGVYRFNADLGVVAGPFVLGLIVDRYGFLTAAVFPAGMVLVGLVACLLLVPSRTAQLRPRRAAQP